METLINHWCKDFFLNFNLLSHSIPLLFSSTSSSHGPLRNHPHYALSLTQFLINFLWSFPLINFLWSFKNTSFIKWLPNGLRLLCLSSIMWTRSEEVSSNPTFSFRIIKMPALLWHSLSACQLRWFVSPLPNITTIVNSLSRF